MFSVTYAAALLAILFLAAGSVLALGSRRGPLTKALSWYCLSAALWIGANAAADVAYTESALVFISGLAFIGGAANLFSFLALVDVLTDGKLPSPRRLLLYALPPIATSLFVFSDLAVRSVSFPMKAPAQIVPGPLYGISLAFLLCGFIYGFVRFGNGIRSAVSQERKRQLAYCFLGLSAMLLGELVFDVILPLMGETRFYTLGPMTAIVFATSCGYAVLRYKLIRLELVIRTLERKVEERTRALRTLQEEQQLMLVDLTHNLQTPLSVLKARLERFRKTMLHDSDIRSLEKSVDALSAYVHELMQLSSLEQALRTEQRDTFSATALINEAFEEIEVIAEPRGIEVEAEIERDVLLRGNRKRIREALMNLASNAMKYGGKKLIVFLRLSERYVAIGIMDDGSGIPEDELPRLFERTYRGRAHRYDTQKGAGLGLAIVERIMNEHDGEVLVESAVGAGTTVTLRFPLRQ